ncbi:MAG: hypothetical protein JXB49_22950 [Bacteroidales bacterium]|nr:hypothetical protein [Bacteroidales bacterium]
MKTSEIVLLIFFVSFNGKSMSQNQNETKDVQVYRSSTNDNKRLSTVDADLLNSLLETSRDTFDFHCKKIAFLTGSSGSKVLSRADFFNSCINPWLTKGATPQIFMVLLTREEKDLSGGYDALVLSWVKVFTNRQKRRMLKKLAVNE